jgi:putative sterol carrier protein
MPIAADIFKEMPNRFKADQAGDLTVTVQFDLSGDNGGQWYVKIADGACTVEEGAVDSPKATIRMEASDYVDMSTGNLNPMAAFMSGKVKVEGDLNTVMKIQQIFGM